MSTWKQLVSVALVGTNQAKPPPGPEWLGKVIVSGTSADRDAEFLTQAGALALYRRAGWKPLQPGADVAAAQPESRSGVSRRSANHLRRMLRGDFQVFLPEWLRIVDAAGLRVPFEQLPALFEAAFHNHELRPLASAVAGKRGEWLAVQNPDWNFAVAETEDLWETGTRDQRAKILVSLRGRDPVEALKKIQSTWSSDPADARTAFVKALEQNLSMADEPFLESALDDRSREVRRAAADLLSRLPDSRLVARMIARATPLLEFKAKLLGKMSLTVNLPPEPDGAGLRDGLDPKAFAEEKKFGERASLLLQILASVPPAHWSRQSGATADKLIAAAAKDEFGRAVISGWALAAMRFEDVDWAVAVFEGPLPMDKWIGVGPSFLNSIPADARASWLAKRIQEEGLRERKHAVWNHLLPTLLALDPPWPDVLARAVAAALTAVAQEGFYWHLRAQAQELLLCLPPELAAQTTTAWPAAQEGVTDLNDFAQFRLEALTALKDSKDTKS